MSVRVVRYLLRLRRELAKKNHRELGKRRRKEGRVIHEVSTNEYCGNITAKKISSKLLVDLWHSDVSQAADRFLLYPRVRGSDVEVKITKGLGPEVCEILRGIARPIIGSS